MSDYRVPKRRLPVRVTLAGGASLDVHLFLAAFAGNHAGEERVEDLLNGPDDFIPAEEAESGTVTLLNRSALVVAVLTQEGVNDPPGVVGEGVEHAVTVLLLDGSELTGLVRYARPEANGRLSDFLNEPTPFLEVRVDGGRAFVGKRHVARIAVEAR
jgi:hypothetical protein